MIVFIGSACACFFFFVHLDGGCDFLLKERGVGFSVLVLCCGGVVFWGGGFFCGTVGRGGWIGGLEEQR